MSREEFFIISPTVQEKRQPKNACYNFAPTKGEITICNLNAKTNAAEIRNKIGFLTGSTGLFSLNT